MFDNAGAAVLGAALAIAGIVLCVVAQFTMGDSWRIGGGTSAQTALVTSGIFGWVAGYRHSWTVLSKSATSSTTVTSRFPSLISLMMLCGGTNRELVWEYPTHERFLRRLESFSRLIVFDWRGLGLSDPLGLDDVPTIDERTEDLVAVLDAVGVDSAEGTAARSGATVLGLGR